MAFKPKILYKNFDFTNLLLVADFTYPFIIGGNSQILFKYFKLLALSFAKDLTL